MSNQMFYDTICDELFICFHTGNPQIVFLINKPTILKCQFRLLRSRHYLTLKKTSLFISKSQESRPILMNECCPLILLFVHQKRRKYINSIQKVPIVPLYQQNEFMLP